jgi:hypothetical protein
MSIEEQAAEALARWLVWVRGLNDDKYWKPDNITERMRQMWREGYMEGVAARIAGDFDLNSLDDDLWHHAEDLAWFKYDDMREIGEMGGKCFAAGYMGGFKSIGGSDG